MEERAFFPHESPMVRNCNNFLWESLQIIKLIILVARSEVIIENIRFAKYFMLAFSHLKSLLLLLLIIKILQIIFVLI